MEEKTAQQQNQDLPSSLKRFSPIFVVLLLLSVVCNIGIWALIYWQFPPTEDIVFLHYNIFLGVDRTGEWYKLLYMPISGAVALLVNAFFMFSIVQISSVMRKSVAVLTIFLQVLLLIATYLIIQING